MPDKVTSILSRSPHMEGVAICLECKNTWQAVAPCGTTHMYCPSCDLNKGVFKNIAIPETFWECFCGCVHFCVSDTGAIICTYCGKPQTMHTDPLKA